MSLYRGPGGSGDATNDANSETILAVTSAQAAEVSKNQAQASATAAASSASAASSSASSAATAKTNAETAETNAETAEANAETAQAAAEAAQTAAEAAQLAAETAETNAETAETNAETAAASAISANSSAYTYATNASNSASAAATSATNASNSATAAATSATNAASSATSAAGSATTATTQASNASTSATNAASSATSAAGSATTATTQAGIATTQATNASSSASAASTSASNAATSATNSANSATDSANSASASEAARDAALSALDSFDDRYLGTKATDPTLDNDGNALASGALYFNTSSNVMKVYDGSSWLAAYASLAGALIATNNLSDLTSATNARTNLGVAIGSNVQAWDADLDSIAALTGTSGLLKKTAANTWSLDTTAYTTNTGTVTSVAASAGTGISVSGSPITTSGTLTITNTAPDQVVSIAGAGGAVVTGTYPSFTVTTPSGTVTSVTGTSPVASSGGATPAISLASGYGDTQNPYASKTAKYFLAAPNASSGVPTFRAIEASDVPTLNQNTTGSAATLTTGRTIGMTGDVTWTSGSFNGSANVTGTATLATVAATKGGTGQTSYAVGDLLYASTTTAISKLADVATGNALISGGVGVAPSYGKIGLTTHVSGTLPIANGGTNSTATATAGGIGYGTGTAHAYTAAGTSGQVLKSNGSSAPTWGAAANTAVAWARFAGGTGSPLTIVNSYNISSITRSGVGRYVVNFTSALSATTYSVVSSSATTQNSGIFCIPFYSAVGTYSAPTTSSFAILFEGTNGAGFDVDYGNFAVFL